MDKNSKFFKMLCGFGLAISSFAIAGSSCADTVVLEMQDTNMVSIPGVGVNVGCYGTRYVLNVENYGYHDQNCQVSCKHIISRENFSVYLHPHQRQTVYGSHSVGKCTMTCTDQYLGRTDTTYFEARC